MNHEEQLNSFDERERTGALHTLLESEEAKPATNDWLNLHSHTFFSYNGYGYSPTAVAWHAHERGLGLMGIVDFDVLDAVDEFRRTCDLLGIRGVAGIETRIFIPEFGDKVINSPGEPGIAYHMGVGFVSSDCGDSAMLAKLKGIAQDRNRGIIERVNPALGRASVSYEDDLLPLAPKGNPTERHLCAAYAAKAEALIPDAGERAAFWEEKLSADVEEVAAIMDDPAKLEAFIRAKTMKRGGVGYVQPDTSTFPTLEEFNDFVVAAGAIPTTAWLDGLSEGEQEMERLLEIQIAAGVEAINIIPDRNWNIADAEAKAEKVAELERIIRLAKERDLPIIVGTEMNAPGQKFVDDFDAPELAPHLETFQEGAYIVYGHTRLQEHAGMGYTSNWARAQFDSQKEKAAFFADVGRRAQPGVNISADINESNSPETVLSAISG